MKHKISEMFDEYDEVLDLPDIEESFDSDTIHRLVMEEIHAVQPVHGKKRYLRMLLIAAVIMCLMTTTVNGVGKLVDIYFPNEPKIYATVPITITGYNGEYFTEVVGQTTWGENIAMILRFDIQNEKSHLIAFRSNYAPEGTEVFIHSTVLDYMKNQ